MYSTATPCRFCGFRRNDQADRIDQPWLAVEDYFALVSRGALVPGWSLICPSSHTHSLAQRYQSRGLWSFADDVHARISSKYGDVRVFEHGTNRAGSLTGCGTDHAHLHMVPLSFSLTIEALRFDRSLKWRECPAADVAEAVGTEEYLFVSDRYEGNQTSGLLCVLELPASQFFRRVIASRIGLPDLYDYRAHPMLEIAASTRDVLETDVVVGA